HPEVDPVVGEHAVDIQADELQAAGNSGVDHDCTPTVWVAPLRGSPLTSPPSHPSDGPCGERPRPSVSTSGSGAPLRRGRPRRGVGWLSGATPKGRGTRPLA